MSARRAVAAANRAESDSDRSVARSRVQTAKVALGERGPHWFKPMSESDMTVRAEATLFALLNYRAPTSSVCPSEVARAIGADRWREHLPLVRDIAWQQTQLSRLSVTQNGIAVERDAKGPVRIARGDAFASYFRKGRDV